MYSKLTLVLTTLFVTIYASARSDQFLYDVTYLGELPGGRPSSVTRATCISNNGMVAGSGFPEEGNLKAVLYDASGNENNISLDPYGRYSTARGINVHGYVVGYAYVGQGSFKAVLFDTSGDGDNIVLGSVSNFYGIRAYAINDNNIIVGTSNNGRDSKAWIFDITGNGNNTYLGPGSATAVSNNGIIVGSSFFGGYSRYPTVFDPTGNGNNISLGGPGSAKSVNDYGEIAGWTASSGILRATLFFATKGRGVIRIGNDGSTAESINNKGEIVGTENGFATWFDIKGTGDNINLNDIIDPSLGWVLKDAFAINENGWVVGRGYLNGTAAKFLLTPVTEPLVVPFNIKPSSITNPVNIKSKGVLPVAILGTDNFDVSTIDIASVVLAGIRPLRSGYEDVAGSGQWQYQTVQVIEESYLVPEHGAYVIDFDKTGIIASSISITDIDGVPFANDDFEIVSLGSRTRLRLFVPPFIRGEEILVDYNYLVEPDSNCTETHLDGYADLTMTFDTQDIIETLGEVNHNDIVTISLRGMLIDGTPIAGRDCVLLKGRQ